jgi:hypothetical protein
MNESLQNTVINKTKLRKDVIDILTKTLSLVDTGIYTEKEMQKFLVHFPMPLEYMSESFGVDLTKVNEEIDEPKKEKQGKTQRPSMSLRRRFNILRRDGFACKYCGARAEDGIKLQIDHIKPYSKHKDDNDDNLVTACFDCNIGKGVSEL